MKLKRIDHAGIVVDDLAAVKEFFKTLGLETVGEAEVKGEWVERIIRLESVQETVVMMHVPEGEAMIELVKFHTPSDEEGIRQSHANTLGIRHLAFAVEDIDGLVEVLEGRGGLLLGDVETYENTYKLCYIRGPEGLIVELAESIEG